ncbi:MAG: DUF1249 domain-containing protein [Nevskiaceae bacterium]|jgi:uncharacterized protein YqiB (DUF1249 family)|nr:DUF1249 domain-containing protein [Nevskiaceae bacterium]
MSQESLIASTWRAKPRGFVALMQLYESNYLRLRHLCGGDPARLGDECLSVVADGCDLRLQVLERSAYTLTLQLTHLFDHERYPDVRLRVYCDARLVQAQQCAQEPPAGRDAPAQAIAADRELRQRWARNIMLNKWLEYCLDLGHRFG